MNSWEKRAVGSLFFWSKNCRLWLPEILPLWGPPAAKGRASGLV